ncbi:MAG: radical SAM protein [Nitrososphaerales archaeon]|nr:radical SAM protein [Nitrososphaerales archaeon]
MLFDPLKLAQEIEGIVTEGILRKYYRTSRPGQWYGGIATADCCGCCLKCVFCWSKAPRDDPERIGKFYSPEHIFHELIGCAEKFGYDQLRVSGNEPTIGREHLFRLLELIDQSHCKFILESNGVFIDSEYARQLSKFKCIHVRISLKGTNREEFSLLTKAIPEAFDLQLNALKNLLDSGVSCHPAAMLSFSPKKNFEALKEKLHEIDASLAREVEEEYVFLYPHVVDRLNEAGIKPLVAYRPDKIPKELV